MSTKYIDLNIHGSSFPSTYIGSGTLIGNPIVTVGGMIAASGYFTGTGDAVVIATGFQPTRVRVIDETDVIIWEWDRGLAATHTIKQVTAGTTTVDTTSAIVVSTDLAGNSTVTLSAALAVSGSNLIYRIEG